MGKESIQAENQMDHTNAAPLKERVEAGHALSATQLKAQQEKEMASLKAEEAEKTAALKAEHAKTGGGTGLLAKLTGRSDPVKTAEQQQLKAEIARAEEQTKAAHAHEKAGLDANRKHDGAALTAAEKLAGNNTTGYHGGAAGSHHSAVLPAAGVAGAGLAGAELAHHHNSNGLNNSNYNNGIANNGVGHNGLANNSLANNGNNIIPAGSVLPDGTVLPKSVKENEIYNHATGQKGLAALQDDGIHHQGHNNVAAASGPMRMADNGLSHEHGHHGHNGQNDQNSGLNQGAGMNNGINQGGFVQGGLMQPGLVQQGGFVQGAPMAAMPMATMPLATGAAPMTVLQPGAGIQQTGFQNNGIQDGRY